MATQRASATVTYGTQRDDVAVPTGTTVAGLMAMLHIDTSDGALTLTRSDGRPADLAAVIGSDLPSGTVLAVSGARASEQARAEAAHSQRDDKYIGAAATAAAVLFAGLVELGVLVVPLLLQLDMVPAAFARYGAAGGAFTVALALAFRPSVRRAPGGAFALPALLGVPAVAAIQPGPTPIPQIATTVGLWAIVVAAFLLWLATRRPSSVAAAAMWGGLAVIASVGMYLGAGPAAVAPLVLALAVLTVRVAPDFALPIPETQLLDLPLLATSASAVRTVDVPAPGRVTRRRVDFAVGYAQDVTETLTVAGVVLAVAASALVVPLIGTTLQGWGAIVALATAALGLSLMARGNRSPLVRRLTRFGAVGVVAAIALVGVGSGLIGPFAAGGALVAIAVFVVFGAVAATRDEGSPLLGRLGDVLQGMSLVLLVPSAVLAAGLFDIVRQAAS